MNQIKFEDLQDSLSVKLTPVEQALVLGLW